MPGEAGKIALLRHNTQRYEPQAAARILTEAIDTHPFFVWNGECSEDYGIMVSEYPAISRPKERVNQITIPGRFGLLMLPESELPVYEPVLRTVQRWVRPDTDIDAIFAWLQGSGSVVFGNEPNRSDDARIINQIDFSKILRRRGFRNLAVPFQCQPYKRLYPPAEDITLITCSGAVELSGIGNGIIPDWEAQACMSLDGGALLNDKVVGDPQYLPPGDSVISWTETVTRFVVTPNGRYL